MTKFTCPHCHHLIEIPTTTAAAGREGGEKIYKERGREFMQRIGRLGHKAYNEKRKKSDSRHK